MTPSTMMSKKSEFLTAPANTSKLYYAFPPENFYHFVSYNKSSCSHYWFAGNFLRFSLRPQHRVTMVLSNLYDMTGAPLPCGLWTCKNHFSSGRSCLCTTLGSQQRTEKLTVLRLFTFHLKKTP